MRLHVRGEHMKRPELPFKKLPVLTHGDLTIAQSTSILRYVAQLPGAEAWYGARSVRDKAKIDECLDHWQSAINPNVVRLTQNKFFYKVTSMCYSCALLLTMKPGIMYNNCLGTIVA